MGKTVLVVDDEHAFTEMVKLHLEADNYDVFTVHSGREGLEKSKF
jgi:DNA-binding response OmpR family regulator